MSELPRRVELLRERIEAEHGSSQLFYLELQCNRCGASQAVRTDAVPWDVVEAFFEGWHLTADPEDADLCPACSS